MLLAFRLFLVLPLVGADLQKQGTRLATNSSEHSMSFNAHHRGFSITKTSLNGELERIVQWKEICAKETIVNLGNSDVALREVSLNDIGKKLLLVYDSGILTQCTEQDWVGKVSQNECSVSSKNINNNKYNKITVKSFEIDDDNSPLPSELSWFLSAEELRRRCSDVRLHVKDYLSVKRERRKRSLREMVIVPGTKWCGPHQLAYSYKELGPLDNVDRCCRRHDNCISAIPPFSKRYGYFNYMPFTLSHCACDERYYRKSEARVTNSSWNKGRKARGRSRRELFMIPGTQWCGRGNRASKYTDLGGFSAADSCCRKHDTKCPFFIPAFETRYGFTNWGISTMMHCTCDERFRTCLKMADTSSANFIGKIFFNMVQTRCFVLKPQKFCKKWAWWGKCERYEYKKQAHIRDNVPY